MKLNTRAPLQSTPTVNVKDQAGQVFKGVYLSVKNVDYGYGPKPVYNFKVLESTMPITIKQDGKYVPTDVKQNAEVAIFAGTRITEGMRQVTPGQIVTIKYLGLGKRPKRGGNAPHEYEMDAE